MNAETDSIRLARSTGWEPGCYVEGSRGWRGIFRVIELAGDIGLELSADDQEVMSRYNKGGEPARHDDAADAEIVQEIADEAEDYLNEHAAPAGHSFGWHDGEFFLWSDETWEEEA